MFSCNLCEKYFTLNRNLSRHIKNVHGGSSVLCEICGKQLSRKDNLLVHKKLQHNISILKDDHVKSCEVCKKEVPAKSWNYHLRTNLHKKNSAQPIDEHLKIVRSCFEERIETYVYENKDETILDPMTFFDLSKQPILKLLEDSLIKHEAFKFNMELFGEYIKKANDEDDITLSMKSFQSKMMIIQKKQDLIEAYINMISKIYTRMQEFQERDSGWTLTRIIHLEININQWKPLQGL